MHSAITQAVLKQPSRRDVIITTEMRTLGTERARTFLKGKLEFKPRQSDCSAQVLTPSMGLPGATGGAEFVVFQFHGIMSQLGRDLWGHVVQTLTLRMRRPGGMYQATSPGSHRTGPRAGAQLLSPWPRPFSTVCAA